MNTIFDDIADALDHFATWDDLAAGLVCATFCSASASMFIVMFAGTNQ